jgi:exopolyphosphatase/guanosine-5'-triphosphate,3'-diphosphate pyrophosphatase
MGSITPRWEWRTFGSDFGDIEPRLRASSSGRRDSSETYIVSDDPSVNAKIREQTLDLKVLQQIDSHRLELWLPVLKASFPLTPDSLRTAFTAWRLTPPRLEGRTWTVQAFVTDVVRPQRSLASIDVTKARYGSVIDGCLVEIADLTFDGTPIRTIAVEMADPETVWRTVRALGLSAFDNVNYVKALQRFLTVHTR